MIIQNILVSSVFIQILICSLEANDSIQIDHLVDTPSYGLDPLTPDDAPKIPDLEKSSATHSYAVDISGSTTKQQMDCLKEEGYKSVFVRAFNPSGDGYFDSESLKTIKYAFEAGLGSEVYITPKIGTIGAENGAEQVSTVHQELVDNGINIRSIWIRITSPSQWHGTTTENIDFISSMIKRAREIGLTVGIYTSQYDWHQITKGWNTVENDVLLWYWHVLGNGAEGESQNDFRDFRAFGKWNSPSVKQFAQNERLCGLTVNRNVYPSHIAQSVKTRQKFQLRQQDAKIMVGSIGL